MDVLKLIDDKNDGQGLKMTLPKTRGVQFEYRTAHLFEKFGYEWDRSGSSLGTDLKILKDGELKYLVNCKKTSKSKVIYLPRSEVKDLAETVKKREAQGLICFGFHCTPIFTHTLDSIENTEQTEKNYKLVKEDSQTLRSFLSEVSRCESSTETSNTSK
ncbi:hypothetical protein AKJ35_00520 [candidate division MSBL1 archaeon SCGC-AAA833F18]|uniref:Restriction endonuclease type IV Mrr domain-containing protein n=1 Tax=candidate division MSBL1 archaeon SCGC-AAA833F18 TaxID=1698257 RepID=A0A133VT57_9EURY|nr:hypothetical protein AKJ35_00520 [candidate division MSBL1 archaeon SCGC-AAA833F18]